jgi:hypothetical protein
VVIIALLSFAPSTHFSNAPTKKKRFLFFPVFLTVEETRETDESGKRGVGNSGRGSMRTPWLFSCARVVRFTQIDFLFVLCSTLLLDAA